MNDATGYTPHFLLYGREANHADESHLKNLPSNLSEYAERLKQVLEWTWDHVSDKVVRNVDVMNRVPAKRLPFVPYKVNEFFYYRKVPRRFYINKSEKKRYHISSKLQYRYTGPYRIVEVISPVLYLADIHGIQRRVHALNMRKRPGSTDLLNKK